MEKCGCKIVNRRPEGPPRTIYEMLEHLDIQKCSLCANASNLLEAAKTIIDFLKKPMNLRAEDNLKQIILSMNEAIAAAEGDSR